MAKGHVIAFHMGEEGLVGPVLMTSLSLKPITLREAKQRYAPKEDGYCALAYWFQRYSDVEDILSTYGSQEEKLEECDRMGMRLFLNSCTVRVIKGTPGPWDVVGDYVYHQHENLEDNPDDIEIARVNREGDATLIAAAPELLDACRMLIRYIEVTDPELSDTPNEVIYARAAIKKAEGRG